jgi:KaiC/GvpD/RAD55 family RecA-like ATPase
VEEGSLGPTMNPGLVEALTSAYASLMRRQRTASAAFVRWISPNRRAHEFAWIAPGEEQLIRRGKSLLVDQSDAAYDAIRKMSATVELNPYEREIQYGYPYLVGHRDGKPIRGPLLTIPVAIDATGRDLVVQPDDELIRFNSLPFRTPWDTDVQQHTLARLIEQAPAYPVDDADIRSLCEALSRDFNIDIRADLDGSLKPSPEQPHSGSWLAVVDLAACFVAPKTSYFLASDLETIGDPEGDDLLATAMAALFGDRGPEPTSEIFDDSMRVVFPFPSNPSQRRVALLAEEPSNRIIVVQGPPGTGKSQTIANVACHLVSQGKRVLISSQKDQALVVVDDMLRSLNMAQLPMTLLRHDRDSRRELKERLIEASRKERASIETATHLIRSKESLDQRGGLVERSSEQLASALLSEHRIVEAEAAQAAATSWLIRLKARRHLRRAHRLARKHAPITSDLVGEEATEARQRLLEAAVDVLGVAG